jgi:hypothetical protein
MGDETKRSEIEQGHEHQLNEPLKPSSAESIEEKPADVAEMPTAEEVKRKDPGRR